MTDQGKLESAGRAVVRSGSPFEAKFGFSRAVRSGRRILVSGTAPIWPDGRCPPDVGGQARRCCEIIVAALEEAGASAADVLRTRMYLVSAGDSAAVGDVHSEFFGAAAPAASMVVVSALLDPRWLVEIEAEAELPPRQPGNTGPLPPGTAGNATDTSAAGPAPA